jgi:catechol 2,3-dioxygenase-like lactoylglutathione lyase family enzyme
MIPISRLNHAVLCVSRLDRALAFYRDVFGFTVIAQEGCRAFLRASRSENHHDLGLLEVGPAPRPPRGSLGLSHLAWELPSIADLAAARERAGEGRGADRRERPRGDQVCLRRRPGRQRV